MKKYFKKQKERIEDQFEERNILLSNFIEGYGSPVILHAVDNLKTFTKILQDGKLKLPKKHSSPKKTHYMEQLLGNDNAIYYSLGFVYPVAYEWNYALLFKLDYIKELKYYYNSINYQCAIAIAHYWYENDSDYFKKLQNFNSQTKKVVDKYLNVEYSGRKRILFDYWKIEDILFNFIKKYKNKKKIKSILKEIEKKYFLKYPLSLKNAKDEPFTTRTPEMIGKKENNLEKNPYFVGFYINGEIPKNIKKILREKYPDKIVFDGANLE